MRKLPLLLLILIFISIFHAWFLFGTVSGYDHPYLYSERVKEFNFFPNVWDSVSGNGFGENILKYFWVDTYLHLVTHAVGNLLHMPWEIVQRVGWFFPFFIIALFAPYYFLKSLGIFEKKSSYYFIGVLIYSLNTYILMVVAGGQMNLALAYSIAPVILLCFINTIRNSYAINKLTIRSSLITGLSLSLLVMLDLRFAWLILLAALLYYCLYGLNRISIKQLTFSKIRLQASGIFWIFLLPLLITLLIHSYWILALSQFQSAPIENLNGLNINTDTVKFFSFAHFENSLSLLHPNWPENIFGKVYFMKPEFLFLPFLAFASLLFIQTEKEKKKRETIIFFALLGLLGAFLAKGTNEPFGQLYLWAIEHIPGFILFRDPTKFYTLVAISYAVLIPFTISAFYEVLKNKSKKIFLNYLPKTFTVITIVYLTFLISPAFLGQLRGTLEYHQIPHEYQTLQNFLAEQSSFSRTAWFPAKQKYAFVTNQHPAVSLEYYFQIYDRKKLLKKISDPKTEKLFQDASIKYVIVPFDSEGEIFLKDYKYSDQEYKKTIADIEKITWLKRVQQFKKLGVFEVTGIKDHFWIPSQKLNLKYSSLGKTEYRVSIENGKKGETIVFNDSFDKNWNAVQDGSTGVIESKKYYKYNSFVLPANGGYTLKIYYNMQQQVEKGIIFSLIVLFVIVAFIIVLNNHNRENKEPKSKGKKHI